MALVAGLILFLILDSPLGVVALVAGAVIEVGEALLWVRYLDRIRIRTGAEGLAGQRAEVIEACRPRGQVRLMGEIWRAECAAGAEVGETVRVVAVRGLTLSVEPLGDPGSAGPGGSPAARR